MGLWSELPGDLLRTIDRHLGRCFDKVRITCVCTYWQSELLKFPDLPLRPQPPCLLLPYKTGSMCGLYDPFENKGTDIDLPEAGEKVFKGTGHGWVVTEQLNGFIDVVNPLTRVRVPLPPRYKFPDVIEYNPENIGKEYLLKYDEPFYESSMRVRDSIMEKFVLSSSPLSDDFVAVAIYAYNRLAYCKVGYNEWHELVEPDEDDYHRRRYEDVTFFDGKLYAVSNDGNQVMVCDDIVSCPMMRISDSIPSFEPFDDHHHLTNSSEGIMIVARKWKKKKRSKKKYTLSTVWFEIYKLDDDQGWVNMKSLDDNEILFMGLGSQILFSQEEFGGNRIYFAHNHWHDVVDCQYFEDYFDNGVFDFEDKSIKPLDYECSPRVICPSPIWFTPNPY